MQSKAHDFDLHEWQIAHFHHVVRRHLHFKQEQKSLANYFSPDDEFPSEASSRCDTDCWSCTVRLLNRILQQFYRSTFISS
jgi:hypothetical protein